MDEMTDDERRQRLRDIALSGGKCNRTSAQTKEQKNRRARTLRRARLYRSEARETNE